MLRPMLAKLHEGPGFLLWTLILDRSRRSHQLVLRFVSGRNQYSQAKVFFEDVSENRNTFFPNSVSSRSKRFRRRFRKVPGSLGAKPSLSQVQQGSGEGSGESLGELGAEPGQVQQGRFW